MLEIVEDSTEDLLLHHTSGNHSTKYFRAAVVFHSGHRPSNPLVLPTLIHLNAESFLKTFLADGLRDQRLQMTFSVDARSYSGAEDSLVADVTLLKRVGNELRAKYPFIDVHYLFSIGFAWSYNEVVNTCHFNSWCEYIWFLEDDHYFHRDRIHHNAIEVASTMDAHPDIVVLRFVRYEQNCRIPGMSRA